jgi:tetratricopeptide (TPR) repeat protein
LPLETGRGLKLQDPGADLLDRATGIWDLYGRWVLGVVAAVIVAGALVFLNMRSRASSEEQASTKLAEAHALFWQGQYPRSLEIAKQVATQYPSTRSGADARRLAGDNAFWSGDFKTAVTEYQAYLAKEKTGLLADAARRSLAYALESAKRPAEAVPIYESLVGKFDRESSGEFLAAAARCYRALNQPAEAVKRLQRLVVEFGETSYAQRGRIELAELSPPRS